MCAFESQSHRDKNRGADLFAKRTQSFPLRSKRRLGATLEGEGAKILKPSNPGDCLSRVVIDGSSDPIASRRFDEFVKEANISAEPSPWNRPASQVRPIGFR